MESDIKLKGDGVVVLSFAPQTRIVTPEDAKQLEDILIQHTGANRSPDWTDRDTERLLVIDMGNVEVLSSDAYRSITNTHGKLKNKDGNHTIAVANVPEQLRPAVELVLKGQGVTVAPTVEIAATSTAEVPAR